MDEHDDQYQIARKRVEARIGFLVHLAVYVVINAVFLVVVGWDFLWATVFWGVGLAFHAANVFLPGNDKFESWKARAIDREVARQRGETPMPAEPAPTEVTPTPPAPPADPDATTPQ
jgi:hypothetical protein